MNYKMDGFDRNEWESRVLTPKSRKVLATAVKHAWGDVKGSEKLLTENMEAAALSFPEGGEKPVVILDMGPASPGGYPVFRVKSLEGRPVVRLSYADQYDYIMDPVHGENGDFQRGSCKYLGVELPVPPANPYRYELYTVTGPGVYAFPLIQGQQKWVRLQLETPGTSVEIQCFYIVNVSDMSSHDGFFLCSDEDITRLWYASTYTAQIASFENSNAWDVVEGWLAPRGLAKSNEVGLTVEGAEWTDYCLEFDFKIMKNPGPVSAAGWVFRAPDENNGYAFQVDLDSRMHVKLRKNGAYRYLKNPFRLPVELIDGVTYHIRTEVKGAEFKTYLDDCLVDITTDDTYKAGRIGFCQPLDKWAFFRQVEVRNQDKKLLFSDDFTQGLSRWCFARTMAFVADGAKRDRLPWMGDLDWAGRNIYYAFHNTRYMADSLRMFAFNQTPEGYVWATCYPENAVRPEIGEYGYYQSDIFSAWFIPTLADYLLYTGDRELAEELYETVKLDADYLWSYVEGDGVFCQRYNTSKGLWSHELEQVGKFAYHNILIRDAMEEAGRIADFAGKSQDAEEFRSRAAVMTRAILKHFWSEELGCFLGEKGGSEPDFMANALALAVGFPDREKARRVADYLRDHHYEHGKIISLVIRGCYEYGFDRMALERLRKPGGIVNWLDALKDWKGPCTTWECMVYPPFKANGQNWGDLSHPDTAMAHILTGYMLGVQPVEPGYTRYKMIPHMEGLRWAKGSIPVPYGDIRCSWSLSEDGNVYEALLESPEGTIAEAGIPVGEHAFAISVNGKTAYRSQTGFEEGFAGHTDEQYIYLEKLRGGRYEITRR